MSRGRIALGGSIVIVVWAVAALLAEPIDKGDGGGIDDDCRNRRPADPTDQ